MHNQGLTHSSIARPFLVFILSSIFVFPTPKSPSLHEALDYSVTPEGGDALRRMQSNFVMGGQKGVTRHITPWDCKSAPTVWFVRCVD